MYVKSSPSQQNAVVDAWTVDFLVLGQATLPLSYPYDNGPCWAYCIYTLYLTQIPN